MAYELVPFALAFGSAFLASGQLDRAFPENSNERSGLQLVSGAVGAAQAAIEVVNSRTGLSHYSGNDNQTPPKRQRISEPPTSGPGSNVPTGRRPRQAPVRTTPRRVNYRRYQLHRQTTYLGPWPTRTVNGMRRSRVAGRRKRYVR